MREFASRPLTPDALFDLSTVHDARFAPSGDKAAILLSHVDRGAGRECFELRLHHLDTGEFCRLSAPERCLFPRWSPNGNALAFFGGDAGEARLHVTQADGSDSRPITPSRQIVRGAPCWSPDGASIAYCVIQPVNRHGRRLSRPRVRSGGLGPIDELAPSIHIWDAEENSSRVLELGNLVAMDPQFSPCGQWLLVLGFDIGSPKPASGGLKPYLINLRDDSATPLLDDHWWVISAAWMPCGARIAFAGAHDSPITVPTMDLWAVNSDGSALSCRTEGQIGNVGSRLHHDMPTWDTSQNHVISVAGNDRVFATVVKHGTTEIWDVAMSGEIDCAVAASGPRSCLVMDTDVHSNRLLFATSDNFQPWSLRLLDCNSERSIDDLNSQTLAAWPKMSVQRLQFASADGLPLEGWVMRRTDRLGPQPLVMFVHGGPFLATGHIFRFDLWLLAANGYSVLFANFRGSAGYGKPFAQAIVGDWGAKGYPDHMAAADAAIAEGFADPNRLGVWGASHGGFATAWIVGHTDRFRAAVVESAATDFKTLYYSTDAPDLFEFDLGGRPDELPEVYRSASPLTYAHAAKTPTLLIHGEEDVRCRIGEAEQFFRALQDAGCTTELVTIQGMTHMGDSTGPLDARLAQNEALLDWFERFL